MELRNLASSPSSTTKLAVRLFKTFNPGIK